MTADEWLAKAIVRMVISDNVLHKMEWKSLKTSIQRLGLELDIDEIYDMLEETRTLSPEEYRLEPFSNAKLETKVKMLIKLAKVAAIDEEIASKETDFFRKATALLGLGRAIADKVLDWARIQANMNKKEKELFEIARQHNQTRSR
ncbi:MAG: hypothetical protein GY866_39065 [Proteobacteria bacterium]|nr:hypothetical protein [Pseudomonadota bacterium]